MNRYVGEKDIFTLEHVKVEMSIRYPSGNASSAVESLNLNFRDQAREFGGSTVHKLAFEVCN